MHVTLSACVLVCGSFSLFFRRADGTVPDYSVPDPAQGTQPIGLDSTPEASFGSMLGLLLGLLYVTADYNTKILDIAKDTYNPEVYMIIS